MNIEVRSMSVFPNTVPFEGDRHYLSLSVSMSRTQIERAICTLLGQLTDQEADRLLRSEFPQLFPTTESIE